MPGGLRQKLLGGRALVFDTTYGSANSANTGGAEFHHADGYNVLYGYYSAAWYGDPSGQITHWAFFRGSGPAPSGFSASCTTDSNLTDHDGGSAPEHRMPSTSYVGAVGWLELAQRNDCRRALRASQSQALVFHLFDTAHGIDEDAVGFRYYP